MSSGSVTDSLTAILLPLSLGHYIWASSLRCTNGVECWQEGLVGVSEESIGEAVQWVGATRVQTPVLTTSVVEAVTTALTHSMVSHSSCPNELCISVLNVLQCRWMVSTC